MSRLLEATQPEEEIRVSTIMRLIVMCCAVAVYGAERLPSPVPDPVSHAIARLTFGERPGDADAVRQLGWKRWALQQLNPESIPENPRLAEMIRPLPDAPVDGFRRDKGVFRKHVRELSAQLLEEKTKRAIYSERQLQEVLADFWFNHFNVYFDKGLVRLFVNAYERDAIRPHVLGKFRDLLQATAQHPAMLFYLDNWQSVSPEAGRARKNGRFRGLNENYARELMELHTLGVDGGYTQRDVVEVARCFTGWTIRDARRGGAFHFEARFHDPGEKTVLGHKIPAGGGIRDGLKVLDLLANHPATARFVSRKLALRFVSDNPPESLVNRMARTFRKTDGDLRAVMKTLIESPEFVAPVSFQAKIKSPFEFAISAVRRTGAEAVDTRALAREIAQMGQPLYRKEEPTGYPETGDAWLNSAGLLARINFLTALTSNQLRGVSMAEAAGANLHEELSGPAFHRR